MKNFILEPPISNIGYVSIEDPSYPIEHKLICKSFIDDLLVFIQQ